MTSTTSNTHPIPGQNVNSKPFMSQLTRNSIPPQPQAHPGNSLAAQTQSHPPTLGQTNITPLAQPQPQPNLNNLGQGNMNSMGQPNLNTLGGPGNLNNLGQGSMNNLGAQRFPSLNFNTSLPPNTATVQQQQFNAAASKFNSLLQAGKLESYFSCMCCHIVF